MDESEIERGEMTGSMLLAARLGQIQASVSGTRIEVECEDCGGEIPARRRAALPNARRCIDCQETSEKAWR